jgi:hypothetical protein
MPQWFERNNQYTIDDPLGERVWGQTLSLVRVDPVEGEEDSIQTTSGWGRKKFMENFSQGKFNPKPILREFVDDKFPFGFIMRSVPLLCVDIDGKNGGLQSSPLLNLRPTLAERSKSGNGYHLFYRVVDAEWHELYGYDEFADANGLVPGVDIRAQGIIYHYPQQRWNNLEPAPVPSPVRRLLQQKKEMREIAKARQELVMDPDDLAIAQEQVLIRLAKPFRPGTRNNTLFAVGAEMFKYKVPKWQSLLYARGEQIGLDEREIGQIIRNIQNYS